MERRASPAAPSTLADPAFAATHVDSLTTPAQAARSATTTLASARTVAYASVSGEAPAGEVRAVLETAASNEDAGRYAAGPLLGVGGMGEVHLLRDARIGRAVARKTLRAETTSPRGVARFLREARVQGQLEHPAIVPVYDLATDTDGRPYFTMKRVRGDTLAHIVERLSEGAEAYQARFPRRRLLASFVQVCMAVAYAHERGVIHRDLKPGNVMLGDLGQVYVLDWGLAKLESEGASPPSGPSNESATAVSASAVDMTREGDIVGTPMYMPLEQLRSLRLSPRADVFALGAILFEILTLSPLRSGTSMHAILAIAAEDEPKRASERAGDVPPELDALCARATARDPEARLESALALAEAVERYLEGDRDLAARRAQADSLLAAARERLAPGAADAEVRVAVMRDALKAMALVPDDTEAQKLLLSLVVDGSGALPPAAELEFAESDVRLRTQGLKLGLLGYASWLCSLPLVMWAGIRVWQIPAVMFALTVAAMVYSVVLIRTGPRSFGHSMALASLTAVIVAMSSAWIGPFVLMPIAACATVMMFVLHATRAERPWMLGLYSVSTLLPFVLEIGGAFAPAFSFQGGDLVLHARAISLPAGPTIAALAYTSVSFLLLPGIFVGRLRDRQRQAERSLFVQAWHLRQLFPATR